MKKFLPIICAAVLIAISLASCQKEKEDTPDPKVLEGIFHFTALENNLEVSMMLESDTLEIPSLPSLLYSLDGKNWNDFIPAVTTVKAEKAGDKVYIKANNRNTTFATLKVTDEIKLLWSTNGYCFTISAKANIGGNLMYLLDGENPASATMGEAAFAALFRYCEDKLIDASELVIPTVKLAPYCCFALFTHCSNLIAGPELLPTELAKHCYDDMFCDCFSLKNAPALPATQLADYCYRNMFCCCTSLKEAPELPAMQLATFCYGTMFLGSAIETAPQLPATQLTKWCYAAMFERCLSLVTPPALPAMELEDYCYFGMFNGCTSLAEAPALPAKKMKDYCYRYMFHGCTGLKHAPELPADELAILCYESMFMGSGIETAPQLPATQLAMLCYECMFKQCHSLVNPPALPATEIEGFCYCRMFEECTSLVEAPSLPARELNTGCYYLMFSNCSSLTKATVLAEDLTPLYCVDEMFDGVTTSGTLTAAPGVDWSGKIPATWEVKEATE